MTFSTHLKNHIAALIDECYILSNNPLDHTVRRDSLIKKLDEMVNDFNKKDKMPERRQGFRRKNHEDRRLGERRANWIIEPNSEGST